MSEPSTSTTFAFKKKKRPQAATRVVVEDDDSLQSTSAEPDEAASRISETLEELIALRKLKRATGGIQLDKLNAGEKKRKPKPEKDANGQEIVTTDGMIEGTQGGLQKGKDRMRDPEEVDPDDASAKLRRGIHSNNFTGQTNAIDVDKHMMEYIEAELAKRKGGAEVDLPSALSSLDPRDELYAISEKYKLAKLAGQEGNIQTSAAMLTAIPEVDLGIDRKLRNIEETERAKQKHYEERRNKREDEGEFAAERFYRARRAPESDADALAKARAAASGVPFEQPKKQGGGGGGGRHATDDQVMDRFKKRQRH